MIFLLSEFSSYKIPLIFAFDQRRSMCALLSVGFHSSITSLFITDMLAASIGRGNGVTTVATPVGAGTCYPACAARGRA
jgi:hypothetical protein